MKKAAPAALQTTMGWRFSTWSHLTSNLMVLHYFSQHGSHDPRHSHSIGQQGSLLSLMSKENLVRFLSVTSGSLSLAYQHCYVSLSHHTLKMFVFERDNSLTKVRGYANINHRAELESQSRGIKWVEFLESAHQEHKLIYKAEGEAQCKNMSLSSPW